MTPTTLRRVRYEAWCTNDKETNQWLHLPSAMSSTSASSVEVAAASRPSTTAFDYVTTLFKVVSRMLILEVDIVT